MANETLAHSTEGSQKVVDYRALFEALRDGFYAVEVIFDNKNTVRDIMVLEENSTAKSLIGRSMQGRRLSEIASMKSTWSQAMTRVVKSGKPENLEVFVHGSSKWIDFYTCKPKGSRQNQLVIIFRDITKRKRREANLVFLTEIGQELVDFTTIKDTMNRLGKKIAAYFNASLCNFSAIDEKKGTITQLYGWHRAGVPDLIGEYRIKDYFSKDFVRVCRAGKSYVVRDTQNSPQADAANMAVVRVGAAIIVPISQNGKWQFSLSIADTRAHDWREDEVELLREITERIWTRLERAEAEEAVAASEERLRALLDKSADAMQLVAPDGSILFSSDSVAKVLGFSAEEIKGDNAMPHIHPDDQSAYMANFQQLLKHPGKSLTLQYRIRHKDGSWHWLETVGTNHLNTPGVNALVGNFRDITERVKAHQAIENSERRFRFVVQNSSDITTVIDKKGIITFQSPSVARLLGYKKDRTGASIFESPLVHPDDLKQKDNMLKKLIKSKPETEMQGEYRMRHANGSWRNLEVVGVNLLHMPVVGGVVLSSRDVTERRAALEKEARLTAERDALQMLNETKDEFIDLAGHQLRTPATVIKQYLGMLLGGLAGQLTKDQAKLTKNAYDSNERQISTISDLLKIARLESNSYQLQREISNLAEVAKKAINEAVPMLDLQKQKADFRSAKKELTTNIDPEEIKQVITNLLDNASKYSPEGTTVTVSLRQSDRSAELAVSDEGVGISDKDKSHIFEKFTRVENTVSRKVPGTGLGLYWCKRLVELHDGSIGLESKPGRGSKFIVRLPLL